MNNVEKELVETMNDVNRPSTYKEEVAQYTKKDAIHALLFFAIIMLVTVLVDVFPFLPTGFWMNQAFNGVQIAVLFVLLMRKRQGLRSVGLHLIDWKKALVAGLLFVVVYLMLNDGLLPGLLGGWQMASSTIIFGAVVRILIQVFYEDVFYVGYFQTRIYGLIKKDYLTIFVGSMIFAISHWPWYIRMAMASPDGLGAEFLGTLAFLTITWIVAHILFNTVFRHLRSIIPVVLLHFGGHLSLGRLWEDDYGNGVNETLSIGIIFGFVLLMVWCILPYLKKRKAAV